MLKESPMGRGAGPQPDAELIQLRNDLWAALDKVVPEGNPMDTWLGPLASLLIARWAGYAQSTQEVAAGSKGASVFELPDALRLSAWEGSIANHAAVVTKALKGMTGRNMRRSAYSLFPVAAYNRWGSPVAHHVAQVAPFMIRAAENSPGMFEELFVWVHQLEFSTLQGRTRAAQLFDEVLWSAVRRNGNFMGEFLTPRPVADVMLELADPKPCDRVYDPCFGLGELLVGTIRRLRGTTEADAPNGRSTVPGSGTFGFEIHPVAYGVGLCRVLLAGGDRPVLVRGDTLERPLPSNRSREGFDCILAAPPWGRYPTAHSPLPVRFPFPSRKTEILFLQHVMANLRPGGRAVVVYPYVDMADPDNQGHYPAGNHVRKALFSDYRVDAVISLPPDMFMPVTGIDPKHTKIMVFRRAAPRLTVPSVEISAGAWGAVPDVAPDDGGGRENRGSEYASITNSRIPVDLLKEVAEWVRAGSERTALELPTGVGVWERPVRDLLLDDPLLPVMMDPSHRLEDLAEADPSLRIEPLENVAEVHVGGSAGRRDSTEHRCKPDIGAGQLRVGDILISTAGDVGRIDIVSAMCAVGSKPAENIAVVRAREDVKPEFLALILRSPGYRNQMESHARRSTIQQLPLRNLCELRMPVPRMSVQDHVLMEIEVAPQYKATAVLNKLMSSVGHDAVAILFRVISGVAHYVPLAIWLENPIVAALVSERDNEISDPWNTLIGCARLLAELAPNLHEDRYYDSDSRVWSALDKAIEAAEKLVDCARVPKGAGRMVVLERVRGKLLLAMEELVNAVFHGNGNMETEDTTPHCTRLWQFLFVMSGFADQEIQAMRESVRLDISVEPVEVEVGSDNEVRLHVTNSSVVPLIDMDVSTRPPVGKQRTPYLADGATIDIPLTVHPQDSTQPFRIDVSWQARHLDAEDLQGETQIGLRVCSTREADQAKELGFSPYNVGKPVEPEMFFGRAAIMDRIRRQLGSEANVILLEGNRRTGKTSILKQLGKADVLSGWIPVYCSFQDAEGDDASGGIATRNVFRLLARRMGWALYDAGVETWFPGLSDRDPARPFKFKLAFLSALSQAFAGEHNFETFELYVEAALRAARPRRVLLMLDEFDKLQEGIDAGVTSPQVPENIRHLLQHQPGLTAILVGSRRLKRLREEYWSALFGFGHRIEVSVLPVDGARRLVTKPVQGRLDYLPQARDRIVELCARHPFLIQSLCNRVFEHAASDGRRTITLGVVERAATEMVEDNEHFRTLWDYARSTRCRLLLAFCERLADGSDPVNLDLLEVKLRENRVPFRRVSDLADDIRELRELELLDLDGRDHRRVYRLAVPLMAKWLRTNVDFDDLLVRARHETLDTQR